MISKYQEDQMCYGLRNKAHKLMEKVFSKNTKEAYKWRSKLFGHIHFGDMNKHQLLMVIKELKQILKKAES